MSNKSTIGVSKENYTALKKAATQKGTSIASVVNSLIEQVGVADKDEKVILSIPMSLTRRNKDALRQWLETRMDALINIYYPEKSHAADAETNH